MEWIFLAASIGATLASGHFQTDVARERALLTAHSQVEYARKFFTQPGDLENMLKKCEPSDGTFSTPALAIAAKQTALCDLMPGSEYSAARGFQSHCDVVSVTDCSFTIRREFELKLPALELAQVYSGRPPPPKYVDGTFPAAVIVHCEIVATLGLSPTWVCGGGYGASWSEDMPMPSLQPPPPIETPLLFKVQSPDFQQRILATAGVVVPKGASR